MHGLRLMLIYALRFQSVEAAVKEYDDYNTLPIFRLEGYIGRKRNTIIAAPNLSSQVRCRRSAAENTTHKCA